MRSVQTKINKLVIALIQLGRIIKIQTQENYSIKFKKIFKTYKIIETTETEIELKKKYYELKKEYKRKGKPPNLLAKLEEMKEALNMLKMPVIEVKNKIEILMYLHNRYKELKTWN